MNNTENNQVKKKRSLISGGLLTTAGIFITKAIGLLYSAPFQRIVGEENHVFYSEGYALYDIMLKMSLAGLPFAIATLVAKYVAKEDYKTVAMVRRLSQKVLLVTGFFFATIIVVFMSKIIGLRVPHTVDQEQLTIYRNVYFIMTLSVFIVPYLSSYRGYFQGLNDYPSYTTSQIIEQIVRVGAVLIGGLILVRVFKLDPITGVYFALFATFLGALASLFYLKNIKKDRFTIIDQKAAQQEMPGLEKEVIFKELILLSLPYLITSIVGSGDLIINFMLFPKAMEKQFSQREILEFSTLYNNLVPKVTSIPTILAPGFSAAIIPHITGALARNDYRSVNRDIQSALETVLFIGLPICFFLFLVPIESYRVINDGSYERYMLGATILRYGAVTSMLSIVSVVLNSLLMALGIRKEAIIALIIGFIANAFLMTPLIQRFGWRGTSYAAGINLLTVITISIILMKRKVNVNFKYVLRKVLFMFISLMAMALVMYGLRFIVFDVENGTRFHALINLLIYGSFGVTTYLLVSNFLQLPQTIFGIDLIEFIKATVNKLFVKY